MPTVYTMPKSSLLSENLEVTMVQANLLFYRKEK